jgi:hypothetical protein
LARTVKDPDEPHALVVAAEIPLPVEMLARVLRAGWYDYGGGRVKAVDLYCARCRLPVEKIRGIDPDTGLPTITPCRPPEWLHGGPIGTRKKRMQIEVRS